MKLVVTSILTSITFLDLRDHTAVLCISGYARDVILSTFASGHKVVCDRQIVDSSVSTNTSFVLIPTTFEKEHRQEILRSGDNIKVDSRLFGSCFLNIAKSVRIQPNPVQKHIIKYLLLGDGWRSIFSFIRWSTERKWHQRNKVILNSSESTPSKLFFFVTTLYWLLDRWIENVTGTFHSSHVVGWCQHLP